MEKIEYVLGHDNVKVIGYGEQIESKYKQKIDKFNNDSWKYGYKFEIDDLLGLVDKSIRMGPDFHIEELNVMFIEKINQISLYHNDEWEDHLLECGIKEIIRIMHNYYLEAYEKYIIKRIYCDTDISTRSRNDYKHQMETYYTFIAYFDIYPFAKSRNNVELVPVNSQYSDDNDYSIEENCMSVYQKCKQSLTKVQINQMRKRVVDIIKRATADNMSKLNKNIMLLANNDDQFKHKIMQNELFIKKF